MAETLYLLDAHSLIFQVFHAIPAMSGPKGQPTNAVFGFTGDLLRLRKKDPTFLICVLDPPGKTFRDELYPEYKAQRAPMPDDLVPQIEVITRVVEAMGIPVVQIPGFEADDSIATLARQAEARGIDVIVCTGDKDMRQLIGDRIKICNLRKDTLLDRDGLKADWGITPEQVIDYLSLVGDSVDNVKGVPGVGPKTATKLLQEHGSVEGILTNLDKMKPGKIRDNLRASRPALELGRTLITLRTDVPLPGDWAAWKLKPWNQPKLLQLFQECGFHRYAREVREADGDVEPAKTANSQQGGLFDAGPDSLRSDPTESKSATWNATYHLIDSTDKFERFFSQFRKQNRFAIDLETTSLDPIQAQIVGYAVCWQVGESYYLAVRGPKGVPLLDPDETLERLKPILENPKVQKLNQNIKYDLLVLRSAGVQLQGIAGDSMVASYLLESGERNHSLDELSQRYLGHTPIPIESLIGKGKTQRRMNEVDPVRVAEYAAEDADSAWRLCEMLEPKLKEPGLDRLYRDLEIPLVAVLAELEYNGITVDVPLLKRLSEEFAKRLAALEKEIHALAGHPFNIDSPKQLRQVLFDELKLPVQRKTGITGEASTGQDVLEDLATEGHELPKKIIEYRQLAKLKGTYVDALPGLVSPVTNRVHASFNQTVAATGRLSSSDPNLQNIPIRTELGRQIRQAFRAGKADWQILAADYSQIELRILAHFSSDAELQRAFQVDRDIHSYVAAQIYGVAESEVTPEQRRNAKTVNFGVIYGLSAFGLAKRLGMTQEEAGAFIDGYFGRYPGVAAFQQKLLDDARKNRYVTTILGRRRSIEGIRPQSSYRQRNQAEREALNTVIQGSAADLIKQAMLRIHRRLAQDGLAARMLLQIHDELVFETPAEEALPLAALVTEEMTTALSLNVPLKVDVAAGPNWLETEALEVVMARS
jgi:DNA polymerase-1